MSHPWRSSSDWRSDGYYWWQAASDSDARWTAGDRQDTWSTHTYATGGTRDQRNSGGYDGVKREGDDSHQWDRPRKGAAKLCPVGVRRLQMPAIKKEATIDAAAGLTATSKARPPARRTKHWDDTASDNSMDLDEVWNNAPGQASGSHSADASQASGHHWDRVSHSADSTPASSKPAKLTPRIMSPALLTPRTQVLERKAHLETNIARMIPWGKVKFQEPNWDAFSEAFNEDVDDVSHPCFEYCLKQIPSKQKFIKSIEYDKDKGEHFPKVKPNERGKFKLQSIESVHAVCCDNAKRIMDPDLP